MLKTSKIQNLNKSIFICIGIWTLNCSLRYNAMFALQMALKRFTEKIKSVFFNKLI